LAEHGIGTSETAKAIGMSRQAFEAMLRRHPERGEYIGGRRLQRLGGRPVWTFPPGLPSVYWIFCCIAKKRGTESIGKPGVTGDFLALDCCQHNEKGD
jgi:hypothetical protein